MPQEFPSHHPALRAPLLGQEGNCDAAETLLLLEGGVPEGGGGRYKSKILN